MLESATRLRRELIGISSLKRQERCYLACLNVFKLVDKKYAWVARPNLPDKSKQILLTKSPIKEHHQLKNITNSNQDSHIVDMEEVNRNFMTVQFMIKLSTIIQNQSSAINCFCNDEIISLLIKYGLFDDAVVATQLFKSQVSVCMTPVLIGLVDRCCSSTNNKDVFQNDYEFTKNNDSIECYSPYEK